MTVDGAVSQHRSDFAQPREFVHDMSQPGAQGWVNSA